MTYKGKHSRYKETSSLLLPPREREEHEDQQSYGRDKTATEWITCVGILRPPGRRKDGRKGVGGTEERRERGRREAGTV